MGLKKEVMILIFALVFAVGIAYSFLVPIDTRIAIQAEHEISVTPTLEVPPRGDMAIVTHPASGDRTVFQNDNTAAVDMALGINTATGLSEVEPGQTVSVTTQDGGYIHLTNREETNVGVVDPVDRVQIKAFNGQEYSGNGQVAFGLPITFPDGNTITTGMGVTDDGTVIKFEVVSPPYGSTAPTTIRFVDEYQIDILTGQLEPESPQDTFPQGSLFSFAQPLPQKYLDYRPSTVPAYTNNFCGDGNLIPPEQCETPNTFSNSYCRSVQQVCGSSALTQDKLGKCNANCQCVYDCNCMSKDEVCNGVDDDCNGKVDDYRVGTCLNQEALCPNQLGVCRSSEKTCAGASGFIPCTNINYNKTGKYQETETYCDNLDNDCDGSIDEGCNCVPESTKPCGYSNDGACRLGTQTCDTSGKWGACVNSVAPSLFTEAACDSIDNDCDFLVDECLLNQCGECGQVPQEICNYRDDDCDAEPQSPQTAAFNQVTKSYFNFNSYCESGTICKGVYADGIDNNNNSIVDEGIDEGVKEKPNEIYTSWCKSCETQNRRCQTYQETKFKQIHSEYYYNYKLDLKEATEKQILQNSSGTFYFACQPNDLDIACCLENQCVYNGQCYGKGHREDIDNDGVVEVCFSQSPGVWHELGEAICENDCTFFDDNIVHAACDGQNGCAFYDSIAKATCDNSQPGWVRDYNSTHYIICPSGSPQPKIEIAASVSCESGTLVKMTRIVFYNGKPVKLVVAACG